MQSSRLESRLETPRDAFFKSLGSSRSQNLKVSAWLGSPSGGKSRDLTKNFKLYARDGRRALQAVCQLPFSNATGYLLIY
jgi:hypothetical protein